MGRCVICKKETRKCLFKNAMVPTYICSQECLVEYCKPLGKTKFAFQETLGKKNRERDCWFE